MIFIDHLNAALLEEILMNMAVSMPSEDCSKCKPMESALPAMLLAPFARSSHLIQMQSTVQFRRLVSSIIGLQWMLKYWNALDELCKTRLKQGSVAFTRCRGAETSSTISYRGCQNSSQKEKQSMAFACSWSTRPLLTCINSFTSPGRL